MNLSQIHWDAQSWRRSTAGVRTGCAQLLEMERAARMAQPGSEAAALQGQCAPRPRAGRAGAGRGGCVPRTALTPRLAAGAAAGAAGPDPGAGARAAAYRVGFCSCSHRVKQRFLEDKGTALEAQGASSVQSLAPRRGGEGGARC